MVKFLTLNCNFEGLVSPMELEQSSSETLDYMAYLTFLSRTGSENLSYSDLALCLKMSYTKLSKDAYLLSISVWFMHMHGISNSSATFSPNLASL